MKKIQKSKGQTKSENVPAQPSEEYRNFEEFANKLFSLTKEEREAVFESERKERELTKRKTRRK